MATLRLSALGKRLDTLEEGMLDSAPTTFVGSADEYRNLTSKRRRSLEFVLVQNLGLGDEDDDDGDPEAR